MHGRDADGDCFRYKFVLHYVNQVILMQQSKGELYQNKITYRQPQEKLRLTKEIWINYDSPTGLTAYQNRHNIAKENEISVCTDDQSDIFTF